MTEFRCPYCKEEVSVQAEACPRCGRPVLPEDRRGKKFFLLELILGAGVLWVIGLCMFGLFIVLSFLGPDLDDNIQDPPPEFREEVFPMPRTPSGSDETLSAP